jgi:hypothetical protein
MCRQPFTADPTLEVNHNVVLANNYDNNNTDANVGDLDAEPN